MVLRKAIQKLCRHLEASHGEIYSIVTSKILTNDSTADISILKEFVSHAAISNVNNEISFRFFSKDYIIL